MQSNIPLFVLAKIQRSVDKVLVFEDKLLLQGFRILVSSSQTPLDVELLGDTTCWPKYRLHHNKMALKLKYQ